MDSQWIVDEDQALCVTVNKFEEWIRKGDRKDFRIVHFNIRSLKKHWDEVSIVLEKSIRHIDCVVFTKVIYPVRNQSILI